MGIADVMTTDLPIVEPSDTLSDAARKMKQRGAKALPVCEGDRLVGMITDWDLASAIAEDKQPSSDLVAGCMNRDLVATTPNASFPDALAMMGERRIHHLLIQESDRFVGMVHVDVEWEELDGGAIQAPMATFTARI